MAAPAPVSSHQLPRSDTSSFLAPHSFTLLRESQRMGEETRRNLTEKSFKGEKYEYGAERPVDRKKGGYTQFPCIHTWMKGSDIERKYFQYKVRAMAYRLIRRGCLEAVAFYTSYSSFKVVRLHKALC